MLVNCNSLVSNRKQALFNQILDEHKPDIICGCESKLDGTIRSEEVFPTDEYDIHRKDKKKGEGGVFIAIHSSLIVTPEVDLNTNSQLIWVKIQT